MVSIVGIALSSVIIEFYGTKKSLVPSSEMEMIQESAYVYASIILAFSSIGLIISVWATVAACLRKSDELNNKLRTTNDCMEISFDVAILVMGMLILALSAVIILSFGDAVAESAFTFAAVILAIACVSVIVSVGKLIGKCLKCCETRVA